MFDDSIELLFSSERAELVTHVSPENVSTPVTGIFEELDDVDTVQQDNAEGRGRIRRAKLDIPASLVITIAKENSWFIIREERWTADGVTGGRSVRTVHLIRREQSTQKKLKGKASQ